MVFYMPLQQHRAEQTQNKSQDRKLLGRRTASRRSSNSQPFDHKSVILPHSYPRSRVSYTHLHPHPKKSTLNMLFVFQIYNKPRSTAKPWSRKQQQNKKLTSIKSLACGSISGTRLCSGTGGINRKELWRTDTPSGQSQIGGRPMTLQSDQSQ